MDELNKNNNKNDINNNKNTTIKEINEFQDIQIFNGHILKNDDISCFIYILVGDMCTEKTKIFEGFFE